ncbi:hypothetical protein LP420_34630 [Massilia sp. B-10]|nr:hypothetical protein LP420_34630 [Massilia sp. B-10]
MPKSILSATTTCATARWSVRRSRGKVAGALQKQAMSLHRLHDQIALGGTNTEVAAEIVARVGLSFEQFTRAVLLAQNEFSAFLKTEENERGELLGNAHRQHRLQRHLAPRLRALQAGTDGHATAHGAPGRPCAAAARGPRRTGNPVRRGRRGPGRGRRGAAGPGTAAALAPGVRQAASRPAAGRTGAGHGTRHGGDAAGRRQHLALLDAVEPARPLAAECARLERETAAAAEAGSAAAAELQRVQAAQLQAAGALAAASAALQAAELAQQEARPGLDQAKALDASMAALAPSHASAAAARQGAQDELAQAAAALVSTQTKLAATGAEHRQAAEWLAAHAHWDTFAAQWPRWDTLLRQAAQAHAAGAGLAAELNGVEHRARRGDAPLHRGLGTALQAASTQLAERDAARQRAIAALAAIDSEQLRQGRQQLEQRREALAAARTVWSDLAAADERAAQLRTQTAAITATRPGRSHTGRGAGPGPKHARRRAGTGGALAAGGRNRLRGQRRRSARHAGRRRSLPRLRQCRPPMAASGRHAQCHAGIAARGSPRGRTALQDNRAIEAAQRALLHTSEQQLAHGAADGKTLEATLARLNAAWHALALAAEAPPEAQRGDWMVGMNWRQCAPARSVSMPRKTHTGRRLRHATRRSRNSMPWRPFTPARKTSHTRPRLRWPRRRRSWRR